MKILYAIQGTGNGHLSRAKEILPRLKQLATVDILVSGTEAEVDLPMEIKYRLKGLGFVFGKKGGVNLLETYKKSSLKNCFKEITELPVTEYDLVISDFEPISVWAAKWKSVPCIGLSHQAAVIHKQSPKPEKNDAVGKAILKGYAPVKHWFGFHFQQYAENIFTPVIRDRIRHAVITKGEHYCVYLPAYSDDRVIEVLSSVEGVKWHIFSKRSKESYSRYNCSILPVQDDTFVERFTSCEGILCGAGFETPAEALFMGKKLMVIPMKGQYEQQCNAAALQLLGVPVIKSLKEKWLHHIQTWVQQGTAVQIHYPDQTTEILKQVLEKARAMKLENTLPPHLPSPKQFRKKVLDKIMHQLNF